MNVEGKDAEVPREKVGIAGAAAELEGVRVATASEPTGLARTADGGDAFPRITPSPPAWPTRSPHPVFEPAFQHIPPRPHPKWQFHWI